PVSGTKRPAGSFVNLPIVWRVRDFIFIDEMGSNLGLTRLYGRATPGQRVLDQVPGDHGGNGHCQLIGSDTIPGTRGSCAPFFLPSGGQSWGGDLSPDLESLLELLTIGGRSKPMATRPEMLRDGPISREEPLGVSGRLEPLHMSLPSACWLVGVLGAI